MTNAECSLALTATNYQLSGLTSNYGVSSAMRITHTSMYPKKTAREGTSDTEVNTQSPLCQQQDQNDTI